MSPFPFKFVTRGETRRLTGYDCIHLTEFLVYTRNFRPGRILPNLERKLPARLRSNNYVSTRTARTLCLLVRPSYLRARKKSTSRRGKRVRERERRANSSARKKEKHVHKSRYGEERKIAKGKEGRKEGTRLDVADGVRRHGVESRPRAARYDATKKYTKVIHHRKRGEAARAARLAAGSCGYRWRRKVETVEVAGHPRCIHSNSVARLTLRRTSRRRCQNAADANCKCCAKLSNAIDAINEFDKAIRKRRRESWTLEATGENGATSGYKRAIDG